MRHRNVYPLILLIVVKLRYWQVEVNTMGDQSSSETSAIDHYDGIFKFVHTQAAKEPFLLARRFCSTGKWEDAQKALLETREKCGNDEDRETVQVVIQEVERYLRSKVPQDTKPVEKLDLRNLLRRKSQKFEEKLDCLPQGVFILNLPLEDTKEIPVLKFLGRKTLSQLWITDKIPEIFCSQITADMILGLIEDWRVTDSKAVVFFQPLHPQERLLVLKTAMENATRDPLIEIIAPFPLLKTVSRKEFTSPADGWDVDPNFDHTLSHGEEHIRQFTVQTLKRLGFDSPRLYDTACSTGVFLASLKSAFPNSVTIGQDLSAKMCDVARKRVDVVHCGSAVEPKIAPGSADVTFNRFLNSEVVTSEEAEMLLGAIVPTVAVGGLMITFGHTPVLLSSSNFQMLQNFEMLSCVGTNEEASSVFQYYVFKRIK